MVMKSRWWGSSKKSPIRTLKERPERLFAIGDIHGCFEELDALLAFFRTEVKASTGDQFVFIGDFIDRGPSSKNVIESLIGFQKEFPKTVFLRGNHEDMALGFLGLGGRCGELHLTNGGGEFYRSYNVDPIGTLPEIVEKIPKNHIEFLTSTELGVEVGEFLFVHAGVSPERTLAEQHEEDLIWIRKEFTQNEHNLGKTVVFGHTPFEDVFLHLPFKIGIDTGLVYGNRLSAIELVHGELLQIDRGDTTVRVSSLQDRLRK